MDAWIAILLIAAVVWYWLDSLRAREFAIRRCGQFCKDNHVQLLDQSVHSRQMQIARCSGFYGLRRYYVFDFSIDGSDRYQGVAVVCRNTLEYLSLLHPDGEIILNEPAADEATGRIH